MRRFNTIVIIVWAVVWFFGFAISTGHADIYTWIDKNGVRFFTNYSPPKQAVLFLKAPEVSYDEKGDNLQGEAGKSEETQQDLAERVAELEEQQKEAERRLAEREAYLQQKEQEAEERIAEAKERAEAALAEAEEARRDVKYASKNDDYDRSRSYIVRYYPYYGFGYPSPHYARRHSLKKCSIYNRKHHFWHRQKPHLKKPFIGNHKNKFLHRFTRKQHISRQRFGLHGRQPAYQARFKAFRQKKGRF